MSLVNILMNQLKTKNPQGYKFVNEVRQSGRNPNDVLKEMYQKGQINDSQLSQIQRQGKMFGVNISDSDLAKIKTAKTQPQQTKKFGGWF